MNAWAAGCSAENVADADEPLWVEGPCEKPSGRFRANLRLRVGLYSERDFLSDRAMTRAALWQFPDQPRLQLSTQGGERCGREVGNLVNATVPYLLKPGRILQQRASDCYQVELAAFQPREQPV